MYLESYGDLQVEVEKDKFRIAKRLRAICEDRNLRIFEMRKLLNERGCEISKSSLANYVAMKDSSVRIPRIEEILKIAIALDIPTHEILGEDFRNHDIKMSNMTDCGDIQINQDFNMGDNVKTYKLTESTPEYDKGDLLLVDYDSTTAPIVGYQSFLVSIAEFEQVVSLSDQDDYYYLKSDPEPRKIVKSDLTILGKIVGRFTTNT